MMTIPKNARINLAESTPSAGPTGAMTAATLFLRHLVSPKQEERPELEKVVTNSSTESSRV